MSRLKWLVCLTTLFVSGCAGGRVIDSACAWVRPVMVSKDDALTDETARQILMHNEQWEAVCAKSAVSR